MERTLRSCVILMASGTIGGAERYLVELATAMSRSPVQPTVVNLKSFQAYRADLVANKVACHAGIAENRWSVLGAIRLVMLLFRLKPDVLLINSNRQAMWLGAIAGKLCRIPLVLIHTHDHLPEHVQGIAAVVSWTNGVIAASRTHHATLCGRHGLSATDVRIVYPGIDSSRTRTERASLRTGRNASSPVIGIVAALRPEKDHETFLHAAARVKKAVPGARFRIVGDGPRKPLLQALAQDLGIAGATEFMGWRTVDSAVFSQLDLLVLSSASETFPAVILESFSAGVPVVATDVGSVAELLGSPEYGLTVPPRDPAALGEAIVRLLRDPEYAQALSERARARVQLFSSDRFCADMLKEFIDLAQTQANTRFVTATCGSGENA